MLPAALIVSGMTSIVVQKVTNLAMLNKAMMQLFLVCPAVLAIIQETMSGFLPSAPVQECTSLSVDSPAKQHRQQVVAGERDTLSEVSAGSLVVQH